MGYLQMRHSIEWGQTESLFKPQFIKYLKYVEFNERDLKQLKHKSFQADNWDQVENFVEYEAFLKNSYFEHLSRLVDRMTDQIKASGNNFEAAKECFENTQEQISSLVAALNTGAVSLSRTQDVKILLPKFSITTDGEIPETDDAGKTFIDLMNSMVVKNDAHYSKFKFARQSNFKPGMINVLGIFENEAIFKRVVNQIEIVSKMYAGNTLNLTFDQEEESKEADQGTALK